MHPHATLWLDLVYKFTPILQPAAPAALAVGQPSPESFDASSLPSTTGTLLTHGAAFPPTQGLLRAYSIHVNFPFIPETKQGHPLE